MYEYIAAVLGAAVEGFAELAVVFDVVLLGLLNGLHLFHFINYI